MLMFSLLENKFGAVNYIKLLNVIDFVSWLLLEVCEVDKSNRNMGLDGV